MKARAIIIGVITILLIILLLLWLRREVGAIGYPPYVPPVSEPPQEPPPELPPEEEPRLPPGEPPPPSDQPLYVITFAMLLVKPSKVVLGDSVRISVKAGNITTSPQEYELYLGPDTGIRETISLAPSEVKTYGWTFTPAEIGSYEVWAGPLHNVFEVVVEEKVTPPLEEPPIPGGTELYRTPGWIVYKDSRGRVYRSNLYRLGQIVDHWFESDGLHRLQVMGTPPFGVWPKHHIFEVDSSKYRDYAIKFTKMDEEAGLEPNKVII